MSKKEGKKSPKSKKTVFSVSNHPKPFRITHVIPKGIRVLMVYTGIMAFFYLLLVFISDITLFFGILAKGTTARFIHFLFFLAALLIVYGIAYRKSWCYHLCITVYSICLLNSIFSIFLLGRITEAMITSIFNLIIPFLLVTILMNLLTLWYVHEKRIYFRDPMHVHKHTVADNVFVYTVYLFYIFTVLFIIISGLLFFMNAAKSLNYIMAVTSSMDVPDAQAYCEQLTDPSATDLCFLSVVYQNQDTADIGKLCRSIDSDYYRFTCFGVVE